MDFYSSILNRRSVRHFTEETLSSEQIEKILNAGLSAPSSKNSNPWYLVALKGQKKEQLINSFTPLKKGQSWLPIDPLTNKPVESIKDTTPESLAIIKRAPLLILVFNNCPFSRGEKYVIETNEIDIFHDYVVEMIGIGAAIENMLLAANALNLGGVCLRDLNLYEKEVKAFLNIRYDLIAVLAIGYPEISAPKSRQLRKDLTRIIG
jgi:nitroreductase